MLSQPCIGTVKEIFPVTNLTNIQIQNFLFISDPIVAKNGKLFSPEKPYLVQTMSKQIKLLRNLKPGDRVELVLWLNGREKLTQRGQLVYSVCVRLKSLSKLYNYETK